MGKIYAFFVFLFITGTVSAANYYVAPTGSDNNAGSEPAPFATIAKAVGLANAGDIVYVRGGIYNFTSTVTISRSGTAAARCSLMVYAGEKAVLNFSGCASGGRGFAVSASYWYIKGLDITKARDNGMYMSGAYNIVDQCRFFDNMDSGLQLGGGAHHNQIINSDSFWNADPTDYGDADGFACKLDVGTGNYYYGCRSWLNVDDGWDGYMRGADDVTTVLENCWTWRNGWLKTGYDPGSAANGNGFKVGGSDDKDLKHNFTLRNCLAFDNKAKGFDQNNNKGSMYFYNCTAYRNGGNNFSIPLALASGKVAEVKNCVSMGDKVSLGGFVVQERCGWLSPFVTTAGDFQSLDTAGVTGPRQADGSLPLLPFAHLVKGSDLIDAGLILENISYWGAAPDLGAFETEPVTGLAETEAERGNEIKFVIASGNTLVADLELLHGTTGRLNIYVLTGQLEAIVPFCGEVGRLRVVHLLEKPLDGIYLAALNNTLGGAKKFIAVK